MSFYVGHYHRYILLIEWLGRLGFPLSEVGDKFKDVDGLFGAYMTRAYARVSVAVAVGNGQRLERWLAGTRPSVLAVRAREAPLVLGMDVGAVMGAAGDAEDRADDGEEAEVLEDGWKRTMKPAKWRWMPTRLFMSIWVL